MSPRRAPCSRRRRMCVTALQLGRGVPLLIAARGQRLLPEAGRERVSMPCCCLDAAAACQDSAVYHSGHIIGGAAAARHQRVRFAGAAPPASTAASTNGDDKASHTCREKQRGEGAIAERSRHSRFAPQCSTRTVVSNDAEESSGGDSTCCGHHTSQRQG